MSGAKGHSECADTFVHKILGDGMGTNQQGEDGKEGRLLFRRIKMVNN